MATSVYTELLNFARTCGKEKTFSECSFSDKNHKPLVNSNFSTGVFQFDKTIVPFFCRSFRPSAADSIHFSEKSIDFVEFKNYSGSTYNSFREFFDASHLFKQLDESLLLLQNCFLPAFCQYKKMTYERANIVINFYIVVDLAVCPLSITTHIISRLSSLPTDPCISKYQKRDVNNKCCFYDRVYLMIPETFDDAFSVD